MNGEFVALGGCQGSRAHARAALRHRASSRASAATTPRSARPCSATRTTSTGCSSSAELYYMPVPYDREQIRQATLETIARNGLRSCYIRPLVFRGYGTMGLFPLDARSTSRSPSGSGAPTSARRARRTASAPRSRSLAADQPRLADPARQGRRPVPQQRPGQGREPQGRLRRGDPARRPRPRLRGLGREHLRRPRRRHLHAAADRRRSSTASTAGRRSRSPATSASRSSSAISRAPSSTSPTRSSSAAPPPSSCLCARSTTTRSARAEPGEVTQAVQRVFEDALHGRAERYREWLDPVPVGSAPAP